MAKLSPEVVNQIETHVTDLIIRLALLGLFVYWSLTLIRPFFPIVLWAIVLAVALFPLHGRLKTRLGGRSVLSAAMIILLALLLVIGPVAVLSTSFVETVQFILKGMSSGSIHLPNLPTAIVEIPIVGEKVAAFWLLAGSNLKQVLVLYHDVLAPVSGALVGFLSGLSLDILKFVLSLILAGFLLVWGNKLAAGGQLVATRVVARNGQKFMDLAAATIRNVLTGVVGVAFLQAVAIGIVFQIAGVEGAGLLGFLILLMSILQIGPLPVTLPVLIWAWLNMSTGNAAFFTLVLFPLTFADNLLKPLIMGRGLSTPTLVIFLGVMGGTFTLGLIGLFLGPVVLSVLYELVRSWIQVHADEREEV